MTFRYQASCELCGWWIGPIWFKRRADRMAWNHFTEHELALLDPWWS